MNASGVISSYSSNAGRQPAYGCTSLLVSGNQIELRLKVQPKLRLYAEPVSEPQSRIARHRPFAPKFLPNNAPIASSSPISAPHPYAAATAASRALCASSSHCGRAL